MIQSLLRAMELLELLKEANHKYSIAELSESTGLPPSTIHRILQTFCEKKYVIRDERSHTYRLGPALIPLGKAAAKGIRLQDAAHPILAALSASTQEDSYLIIPVGNKGLVIEKVDGPNHLKVVEEFGYEMYLHCGAIRKVLLAFQSPSFIDQYLNNIVIHDNAFPHVESEELRKELEQIRSCGYAITYGDYVNDAAGIGGDVRRVELRKLADVERETQVKVVKVDGGICAFHIDIGVVAAGKERAEAAARHAAGHVLAKDRAGRAARADDA